MCRVIEQISALYREGHGHPLRQMRNGTLQWNTAMELMVNEERNGSQPQMEWQWQKWEMPIEAIGRNSGHCGISVLSIISIYYSLQAEIYVHV